MSLQQLKVKILGQSTLNQYSAIAGVMPIDRLFSDIQLEIGQEVLLVLRKTEKYWSVVTVNPPDDLIIERESLEQIVTRRLSQAMCELRRLWIPFQHLGLLAWEIQHRQLEMKELLKSGTLITTKNDCYGFVWANDYQLDYVGEAAVNDLVSAKKWLTSIPVPIGKVVKSAKNCIYLGQLNPSHAIFENNIYPFTVEAGIAVINKRKFNIPTFKKTVKLLKSNQDVLLLREMDLQDYNIAFNGKVDISLVKFALTKVKHVVLINHKSSDQNGDT